METSPRSRTVALVLSLAPFCTVLFGLHRLYAGRIFTAILQMLTFGGFCIWQIYDVILILLGEFEDAQKRKMTDW